MPGMDSISASLPSLDAAALRPTPNPRSSPEAVGRAFEGFFATMILKQMRQASEGESLFGEDKGDVRGGLFDHFMGEHVAKSGHLGIASMIRSQLERRSANS